MQEAFKPGVSVDDALELAIFNLMCQTDSRQVPITTKHGTTRVWKDMVLVPLVTSRFDDFAGNPVFLRLRCSVARLYRIPLRLKWHGPAFTCRKERVLHTDVWWGYGLPTGHPAK